MKFKPSLLVAASLMCSSFAFADDCSQLLTDFAAQRQKAAAIHSQAVQQFKNDADLVQTWYNQLSPYEGRTVRLPYGMFDAFRTSAEIMYRNAQTINSNFNLEESESEKIFETMKACIK